jgi:hypothetical protein
MVSEESWRDNWRAVAASGAVRVDVARSAATRRAAKEAVRRLAPGTHVVLCAAAPGAIGRCRRFAAETGITVERAYLAFPSVGAPAYLVEDAWASIGAFVERVLVTPPRARWSRLFDVGLAALRLAKPWRFVRRVAPGRVVVGTRT